MIDVLAEHGGDEHQRVGDDKDRIAEKPPKAMTIRITHPNSCSLKYDELDLRLRDMLEASGIEPKEPKEGAEATESVAPAAS